MKIKLLATLATSFIEFSGAKFFKKNCARNTKPSVESNSILPICDCSLKSVYKNAESSTGYKDSFQENNRIILLNTLKFLSQNENFFKDLQSNCKHLKLYKLYEKIFSSL